MIDNGIYDKLARFCAYQERCVNDIKQKMYSLKVEKAIYDEYVDKLKADDYLDEDRFVKAFITGHLRKKWGKQKIKSALSGKGVNQDIIKDNLDDVGQEDYDEALLNLAERKIRTLRNDSDKDKKNKAFRFLMGKGYESSKITAVLKKLGL